jgi:hypothetical protein
VPSYEKSLIKVGAADEILENLQQAAGNLRDHMVGVRGSLKPLKMLHERMHGIQKDLIKKHEDSGKITDEEGQLLRQYGALYVNACAGLYNQLEQEVVISRANLDGMAQAIRVVEAYRKKQEGKGELARRMEAEAEEDRVRLKLVPDEEADAPVAEEQEEADAPAEQEELEAPAEAPASEEPSCSHCSEPITVATGSKLCSSCASYKNRYEKLPPPHVLERRRERANS